MTARVRCCFRPGALDGNPSCANLARLPFVVEACFGDEIAWPPLKALWPGRAHQQGLHPVGLARLATACVRRGCCWRRHRPDVVMVEFGFHAVRVMELARTGVPKAHFGADARRSVM